MYRVTCRRAAQGGCARIFKRERMSAKHISFIRMKDKKGKNRSSEQYLMTTVMNSKQASK